MSMDEVAEKALECDADRAFIVDRWQGGPGKIEFFHVGVEGLVPVPPILYVAGIRLQREFAPVRLKPVDSVAVAQSVNNSLEISDSLSKFFNLPALPEKEALSDYQVAMHISQDLARRIQITFMLLPQKVEIGPRITMWRVECEPTK
jgi:rRNA maturation protein Rpf1